LPGAIENSPKNPAQVSTVPDEHPYLFRFPNLSLSAGAKTPPEHCNPSGPVITIKRTWICQIILIIVILGAAAAAGSMLIHASQPVRIGVLLPITGDIEVREPLEWAQENINRAGGIGGRPVELVYRDTGTGDTVTMAHELLADDFIRIVIGPPTSDDVFLLAPEFIKKEKILISPFATSGDIIRAFGKKGYFWRTTQGDVAQVKVIITRMKEKGVSRVALLAENSTYGKTFYDWTGFFVTEYGLELASIRQFEPATGVTEADIAAVLNADPEYLIVACGPEDAATIKKAIDRSKKPVRLFFTDAAASPVLVTLLGEAAEGIEGTSPTADPTTGFSVAYREKFNESPADYAAPIYDALLLAAYTTARQDAVRFESPADAIRAVVYGSGTQKGWDAQEAHETILALRAGQTPAISGASGPLDFDSEFGVDPLATYYSHWVIEDGTFRTIDVLGSAKSGTAGASGESVSRTRASGTLMALTETSVVHYDPPQERTDFRAVIVGPSQGWKNYRHQSDALAVYSMLRENGVPDEHIILMIYDDVPNARENPLRGDIHNMPKGENLRANADVDYTGNQVTAATFRQVLLGEPTSEIPVVLDGTPGTDVFVYVASHGTPGGIVFSGKSPSLTTQNFTEITDTMSSEGKYRQIVFFVDTCFGESIATNATAKGLLYFTGAAASEPSHGAVYDIDIRQWLSDEFTAGTLSAIRADPDITFRELYIATYEKVTGSHVRMLNTENFGSIDIPVRRFLQP